MSENLFPLDDVSLLGRAIDCAQMAVRLQRNYERERIERLLDDIRRAAQRPCEAARVLDDHSIMFAAAVQLADRALHQHDKERAQRFGRVITALLPDIQQDLLRALELRANTRPTP